VYAQKSRAELDSRHQAAAARTRREGRRRKGCQCSFCLSPQPPKNQEQCNTTVGDRSLLHYSHGSTASKRKEYSEKNIYIKKMIYKEVKRLNVDFFFPISLSAFHMLLWVSALSRTFSQQFRMQVDNGGKEVVKLK